MKPMKLMRVNRDFAYNIFSRYLWISKFSINARIFTVQLLNLQIIHETFKYAKHLIYIKYMYIAKTNGRISIAFFKSFINIYT